MVTKMLKLTMRQIRSSLTRFLAIAAIVALGVGFFCGLRLTKTAMVHTLDDYAEAHRMYDFRLVSTVGFDETDADVLAADARIASCEGEKSADALASVADGAAKPCRFLSLPVQINFPGLKCGRLPQTAEECLADGLLYSEKDLGKTVVLTEENDEDTLDSFNRREFTIVGIAKSVLYINYERGGTSIGSGTLSSFVYILPEAFALDYETSLYLRLADRQGEVYSDEYTACIDAAEPWVTQLAESAAYGRSDRLYEEAEQTLSDARETLDEKQQELADAKQELADAKQELKDAHQTYADGVVSLADAKQEADGTVRVLQEPEDWRYNDYGKSGVQEVQLLFSLPLAGPYTVTVEPLRGGARQTLTQDDLPGDCLPLTGPNAKYTVAADLQGEDGAVYHAQYIFIFRTDDSET